MLLAMHLAIVLALSFFYDQVDMEGVHPVFPK